ncbi:hypothetical protein DR950_08635 [Kitasatospora xanthocidica]|uniref:Uncharacterized protein n=1 Tax=Kitasatospora xanthocidica TaxID=83382 RepID=A0A372ZQS5_9ACTN|nr:MULTISPECIES: hypothetical protein [Streptomycetaceae]OKI05780.1 hypothetical protein AMK13_21030 [Streptomyces sp. CB02056]RGD57842.1 hypothetical protein DR950_08635 [Kitasatospora xanthocidica]
MNRRTSRTRRVLVRLLAGSGLAAVLLYTEGQWESRSGGLMLVADLLNQPELLIGGALAALIAAAWLSDPRAAVRTATRAVTVTAGVVFLLGVLAAHKVSAAETRSREDAPAGAERALVVVHRSYATGPGPDERWQVLLESGEGWSARRWSLADIGRRPGDARLVEASWTGRSQITVVTDSYRRVFNLDQDSGEPVEAR